MKTLNPHRSIMLLCAILGASVLTTSCGKAPPPAKETAPPPVAEALPPAPLSLLGTPWRLTQLGDQPVDNPPGDLALQVMLSQSSTNFTGFAGCNRIFGQFALDGQSLKFDGVAGTRMYCTRIKLEEQFIGIGKSVASWKIEGDTLSLMDATGKTLATFTSP